MPAAAIGTIPFSAVRPGQPFYLPDEPHMLFRPYRNEVLDDEQATCFSVRVTKDGFLRVPDYIQPTDRVLLTKPC
jgi:hypothetical protein